LNPYAAIIGIEVIVEWFLSTVGQMVCDLLDHKDVVKLFGATCVLCLKFLKAIALSLTLLCDKP
jgi:hypothetical protein